MNTLDNMPSPGWLIWFMKGLLVFVAIILFARLGELQLIKGSYYRNLSDNNRIRKVSIRAPRGQIITSDNQTIVGNTDIQEQIVFTKDGFEKSLDISNAKSTDIITEPKRSYFLGKNFAHVTGYLSEVNEEEVNKVDPKCPDKGPRSHGSFIGRGGLEEEYDCLLRGIDGEELIEVDALGQPIRTLGKKLPIPGSDLHVSLNALLQKQIANIFDTLVIQTSDGKNKPEGRKGAVVVTNSKGSLLALYSAPSFDPNIFINNNSKAIVSVVNDNDLPLFNRAITGLYHPGSTFKIVTSTAALEENKIDDNFTYEDKGFITLNGYTYNNWYWTSRGGVEGEVDLVRAIARSTDTFFYKVGEIVGIDSLAFWSKKFKLDSLMGIDIPGEAKGIIPDPAWKRQVKGELWFLGDTFNVSIGQGDVAITPLAANILTAVIANEGKICNPHINSSLSEECQSLNIREKTLSLIEKGMKEACSEGGTAFPFFEINANESDPMYPVACKTGTAETGDEDKTHSWFTAFVPGKDIVVTVLVEKAGQGSEVAAPIAKEVLKYYFSRK